MSLEKGREKLQISGEGGEMFMIDYLLLHQKMQQKSVDKIKQFLRY